MRTTSPRTRALDVARGVGAGQLLLGGVVGTPGHVALNASLLSVSGGAPRAEARAEGPADSLPRLVDQLIAQLITEGAGESHALDGLANASLSGTPALPRGPGGAAPRRVRRSR